MSAAAPARWAPRGPQAAAWAYYAACLLITLVFLFPVLWVFLSSFKPAAESMRSPPSWLPSRLSLENYRSLGQMGAGLWRYVGNSVLVGVGSASLDAVLASLAAFGFSRFRFRGSRLVFVLILSALMVPFQTLLTPLFIVLRTLGLNNTLLGLGLVYATLHLPLAVFLMLTAFQSVPRTLDEAAMLDGAGPLRLLLHVLVPLVAPSLVTVLVISFIASWNEFLAALILMTDQAHYTMPVMLVSVQFGYMGTVDWGALQAGTALTILPCLLITLCLQRFYVRGLVAGATKE